MQQTPLTRGWRWHSQQLVQAVIKPDWKAVVMVLLIFRLGNAFKIAFGDQQNIMSQRDDLQTKYTNSERACVDKFRKRESELSGVINQLKQDNARERSAKEVLGQQVQSQRKTIDNFARVKS